MAGKALLKQGEDRRKSIVRFIQAFRQKNGYSPTISEIADHVGLGSANATRHHLLRLQEAGVITMDTRVGRSIAVVEDERMLTLDEVKAGEWPANTRFLVRQQVRPSRRKQTAKEKLAAAS